MRESGYERMPPVEETLASYLSMGDTASLKVPSLPFKSLQDTSRLNGSSYAAAGQAVASLHTMAVLQAYQADLLKDLDDGQGLSPDEVAELRSTTDLALRATKQAATAMGRSMVAMVVTERHLWVNLADLEKKEKGFLLDAPVSPSERFGTSVETVVEKFKEARARSAAFETFIPRRPRSEPEQSRGPGPARPYHRLPLSNSPATTISSTWPWLGGNLDRSQTGPMMTFGTGSSKLPYWWSGPEVSSEVSWNLLGLQVILVCKSLGNPIGPYQDLFMRLLVEPALLPSP